MKTSKTKRKYTLHIHNIVRLLMFQQLLVNVTGCVIHAYL